MKKSELNKLNDELGRIMTAINEVATEYPSIMISYESDGFNESFSSICQTFEPRLDLFRKRLRKIADKLPKKKKK